MLLNDLDEEHSGELCCYPGSHFALAEHLKSTDSTSSMTNLEKLYVHGASALPNGPKTDDLFLRPAVHCLGKAGDAFILNFMTAHLIAPNISPHIRYAVYFRITNNVDTVSYGPPSSYSASSPPPSMMHPWMKWVAMDKVVL